MTPPSASNGPQLRPLPNFIFMSRWLQLPLYDRLLNTTAAGAHHRHPSEGGA